MPNRTKVKVSHKSTRNTVRTRAAEKNKLPTESDIQYLTANKLPRPPGRRVIHNTYTAFTAEVRAVLHQPEVAAWFGSRVDPDKVDRLAQEAGEADAMAARLRHGADLADQHAAPANAALLDVAQLVDRDWEAFAAQFPGAADQLEPLRTWWVATHPGGGPRTSGEDESAEDKSAAGDKASTPAATSASSKKASSTTGEAAKTT